MTAVHHSAFPLHLAEPGVTLGTLFLGNPEKKQETVLPDGEVIWAVYLKNTEGDRI